MRFFFLSFFWLFTDEIFAFLLKRAYIVRVGMVGYNGMSERQRFLACFVQGNRIID